MTELLTTEEVAERIRVPAATLRWWRHLDDGTGPKSGKVGRRVMYRAADVDAWIDQQFTDGDNDEAAG